MTTCRVGDLEPPEARVADSDWVDAQFAAIIAANWADRPSLRVQRIRVALAVRVDRADAGGRTRSVECRVDPTQPRPLEERWPRERSPPRTPTGRRLSAGESGNERERMVVLSHSNTGAADTLAACRLASPRARPTRQAG